MEFILTLVGLILLIVVFYGIYILVKIVVKGVIEFLKTREILDYDDRTIIEAVLGIIILAYGVYLADRYNWFGLLKLTQNITKEYDWLSFIGTIASALLSALLLIVVTRKERRESNQIVARAQRPYLNIEMINLKEKDISNIKDDKYTNGIEIEDSVEVPCLKITNVGQTTAIIDVNSSKVNIKYTILKKLSKGKVNIIKKKKEIMVSEIIKRLAISADKTIYILFDDEEFNIPLLIEKINITECYIKYKDLFGYEYEDKSFYKKGKIEVEIDNKVMNEVF